MDRLVENGIANDIEHQYRGLVRIASPLFHLILLVLVNLVLDISSRQNQPEHLGLLEAIKSDVVAAWKRSHSAFP